MGKKGDGVMLQYQIILFRTLDGTGLEALPDLLGPQFLLRLHHYPGHHQQSLISSHSA